MRPQDLDPRSLPPATVVTVPAIRDALSAHEQAVTAAKTANAELTRLERDERPAAERDAQELAAAISAGKSAPKPRHVVEQRRQLEDARRRSHACEIVRQQRWKAVIEAFERDSDRLAEQASKNFESKRAALLKKIDELEQAQRELAGAMIMRSFVADTGGGRYRASAVFPSVQSVPAPRLEDGDRLSVGAVFAALRQLGEPLRPREVLMSADGHLAPAAQGVSSGLRPPGFSVSAP